MNLNKFFTLSLTLFFVASGCNSTVKDNSTSAPAPTGVLNGPITDLPNGTTLPTLTGANVLTMTVNGSTCGNNSYPNKPCVTVTVCTHSFTDASHCDTVSDILVDTGSYGLRIFGSNKNVLNHAVPTSIITTGSNTLAECASFGDGSQLWGPVQSADVILGGEAAVQIPIQIIDSTYSNGMTANCSSASVAPTDAGFNGILGVGLAMRDCGSACVGPTGAPPALYYSCNGSSCSASFAPLANQIENPVSAQAVDNNGVVLELPTVGQAVSVNGYLVLGIGTQSNNVPASVTKFSANGFAEFKTSFEGQSYTSFIDSGSNAYYFPSPGTNLPDCGPTLSILAGFYCPSGLYTFTGINVGSIGSPSGNFQFQVDDFVNFYNSPNYVDSAASGTSGGSLTSMFDIGLPFFLGRNVYVGIDTKVSTLGTGPYWAY